MERDLSVDDLIAYWQEDPSLDELSRRACRELTLTLARSLPAADLRMLQREPQRHRQEIGSLVESFAGLRPYRDIQVSHPVSAPASTPEPSPPVRQPDALPLVQQRAAPEPISPPEDTGREAVRQTVTGDGNMIFGAGHIGGSLRVEAPGGAAKPDRERPRPGQESSVIRILFLGANPQNTTRLRLDAEVREIDRALMTSDTGRRFELHQKWAVRVSELQMHLLRHKPDVLHFSGHGSTHNAILLEGDDGRTRPVEGGRLARLLAQFNRQLRCVVLNACYSEEQAKAVAQHVDCVIGMTTRVMDRASIRFAASFYQALAFGCSVRAAFDMSCADIELNELDQDSVPRLIAVRQDPATVSFITAE